MFQKLLNLFKKYIPIDLEALMSGSSDDSNIYQKYGIAADRKSVV